MNILKLWKTLLRNWEVKTLVFEPRFAHLWYTRRTHRGKAFVYSYLDLFIIYLLLFFLCWQTSFFSLVFFCRQSMIFLWQTELSLTFKRAKNGWWFISGKIFNTYLADTQINFCLTFLKIDLDNSLMSEDEKKLEGPVVIGGDNLPSPFMNRVNWFAKYCRSGTAGILETFWVIQIIILSVLLSDSLWLVKEQKMDSWFPWQQNTFVDLVDTNYVLITLSENMAFGHFFGSSKLFSFSFLLTFV